MRALLKEWPLWALVFLGAAVFGPALASGRTFYYRDLHTWAFPRKQLITETLLSGRIPLWDPLLHGGAPLLANPTATALYPSQFLYLLLPIQTAFNLDIVLHLVACSVAAFALARVCGLNRTAAFVTGVVFGYCGYTLSLANLMNRLLAMPWLPLSLAFWHLYLTRRCRRYALLSVVALACQLLAGAPETTLPTVALLAGWTLFQVKGRGRERLGALATLGLVSVLAAAVAAVQLLPSIVLALNSGRGRGADFGSFSYWSVHPVQMLETLLPGFLGRTDRYRDEAYWGRFIVDNGFPYILSLYWGLVPLALAAASPWCGSRNDDRAGLARRLRVFLFGFATLCGLLSLGRFLPGFETAYPYIPVLDWFRYPVKFLVGATLPIALLAGCAIHGLASDPQPSLQKAARAPWPGPSRRRAFRPIVLLAAPTAILAGVIAGFLLSDRFPAAFSRALFRTSSPEVEHGLRAAFLTAGAVWAAALLAVRAGAIPSGRLRPFRPALLAGLITCDLLAAGRSLSPTAPESFFTDAPESARTVRETLEGGRLYRCPDPWRPLPRPPADDDIRHEYETEHALLRGRTAALYGIPLVFDADQDLLGSTAMIQLSLFVENAPWQRRLPIVSAGAASLVLSESELDVEGLTPLSALPDPRGGRIHLYRNERACAAGQVIHVWRFVGSSRDALGEMQAPGFDPRRFAVVEGEGPAPAPCPAGEDRVKRLAEGPLDATYSVSSSCGGLVYFPEPWAPGWQIFVDGRSTRLEKVDGAFSGVFVEPGDHTIERRYRPRAIWIGAVISGLSCLLLCGAAFPGVRGRERNGSRGQEPEAFGGTPIARASRDTGVAEPVGEGPAVSSQDRTARS